jgi:hypothetical protein
VWKTISQVQTVNSSCANFVLVSDWRKYVMFLDTNTAQIKGRTTGEDEKEIPISLETLKMRQSGVLWLGGGGVSILR